MLILQTHSFNKYKKILGIASLSALVVIGTAHATSMSTANFGIPSGDTRTYGALSVDVDNDGDQDVLLNNHGESTSGLYINDGTGHLTLRPGVLNVGPDRHDCDPADVDGNGLIDFYCSAGANWGTEVKQFPTTTNELLLQQADGTFVNASLAWGVDEPTGRGRDVVFLNANNDSWPDLVVTNDSRPDGLPSGTTLYINNGGTGFVSAGPAGLATNDLFRCAKPADWNKDGLTDLALCTFNKGIRLFENKNGLFVDVTTLRAAGSNSVESWGVEFVDMNNDGYQDMVRTNASNIEVRLWNNKTAKFVQKWTATENDARDVAVGLYNHSDSIPDIYVLTTGCTTCAPTTNPKDDIYVGKGDGTFTLSESTPALKGTSGSFVSTWDFNGDGFISWIVGNGKGSVKGPLQLFESSK